MAKLTASADVSAFLLGADKDAARDSILAVPIRSVQVENADFALGDGEDLLIHRVASVDPVTVDCDALAIGTTAAVEWYGSGKVSLSYSDQVLNANDRVMSLKERGSRVFLYRASADELQVLNPDNLKSNIPEDSDIVFELLGNVAASTAYNDSRGTGQKLGTSRAITTDALNIVSGIAVAIKLKFTSFPGAGFENVILYGDVPSGIISSYNGAGAPAPVSWVFRQNLGGTVNDSVVAPDIIGHDLAIGEWLRFVCSIEEDGTSVVYVNGSQLFGGSPVNSGTHNPGKLAIASTVIPGSVRIWDRSLTGPEIDAAIEWLNNN